MKFIKNIFLLFIFILLIFNCKIMLKTNDIITLSKDNFVYLNTYFSPDAKVNGKILLTDLTNDLSKYISVKETTDDVLNSGNYIFRSDDLERIKHFEILFFDTIKNEIERLLLEKGISLKIHSYHKNISKNAVIVSIRVDEFNEGELNFIKNEPSIIKIHSNIFAKVAKLLRFQGIDFHKPSLKL